MFLSPGDPLGLRGLAPPRWQCLGGCFTSSPAAILDTTGFVHLFVRGCDRALWRLSQQARQVLLRPTYRPPTLRPFVSSLEPLQPADVEAADPAVALRRAEGTEIVAGRADRGVKVAEEEDITWSEWVSMGGIITNAPTPAVDSEGMLHVFCRGITRALTHVQQRWNGTAVEWKPWESLGGALASGPQQRGITDGTNFLNIYVRGGDKAVWRKFEQANVTAESTRPRHGVRWSNWESLGGVASSGVAVATTPDGLSEVFARGPDGGLWHKRQTYNVGSTEPGWGEWSSLSGTLSSAPEVAHVPALQAGLHVFSRGLDGSVWHKTQVGRPQPNGSIQWTMWRSLGGATSLFSC